MKQNLESIIEEYKKLNEIFINKNFSGEKQQAFYIKKYNKLYKQIIKLSMPKEQRKYVKKIRARNTLKNIALFPSLLIECILAIPVKIFVLCTSWPIAIFKVVQKEETQLSGEKGFLPWMQEISFRTTTPLSLRLIYSTETDKECLEGIYREVVREAVKNTSSQDNAQLESITLDSLHTTEKVSSQPIKAHESTKINLSEKEIQK